VGAHGKLTPGPNVPSPGAKYKRSKNIFFVISIVLNLRHIWARLLELPAQSLIGSPGTLTLGVEPSPRDPADVDLGILTNKSTVRTLVPIKV